jgi:hypothetical protein
MGQYEKDCRQLGELFLKVDGHTRTFSSSIGSADHPAIIESIKDAKLMFFDTTDGEKESAKYRIVFGIVEI